MKRSVPGAWLLAMGLFAGAPAGGQAPEPADPLGLAWSRPVGEVIALAVSPDGSRVLAADRSGTVSCFDAAGSLRWRRMAPGLDSLAISREGRTALLYAARQPHAAAVLLVDDSGAQRHVLQVREPITCAVVAADGTRAVVGAGRHAYYLARRRGVWKVRAIPCEGEVRQARLAAGDTAFLATARPASVLRVKPGGAVLWRMVGEASEYTLSASADGRRLAVAAASPSDLLTISLLDVEGRVLWSDRRPGRAPVVHLCQRGGAMVLSYEHRLAHSAETRFERRLWYLGGDGAHSWTKGGAYTAPLLVAADADGEWVVGLETQRDLGGGPFRLFDRRGQRRWMYAPLGYPLIAAAAADGSRIAAYGVGGRLEVLRVTVPEQMTHN